MRRACALVLLTAGSASAAPVDLDGDGKPETVELVNGELRVNGARKLALETRAPAATFEAATTSSGSWLVVKAGDKAFVVSTRTWQVAATAALGGVGLDREYELDVAATPDGVFKYQKRGDIRRCDGKPALLFAERLDAKGTTPPVAVGTSTPLTAKPDAAGQAPVLYQARAASSQAGAPDAGALAIPRELDDGNPSTAWREELPGAGEGQFFTFVPRVESVRAQTVRIVTAAKPFNRPKLIAIVGAREAYRVELPEAGGAFAIDLPRPVTGCVTVILESVHGRPNGTTAIAELEVFAEGERAGGGEALLARVVAEGKGEVGAAAALAKRGAAAAAALEAELVKATDAAARRRLVVALAKVNDPAATPALVRAVAAGWVRDKDLLDVITALGTSGQVAALAELAAKGNAPHEVRVAAASQLRPTGAGYDALVDLAGDGPRELRRAVIERLALAPSTQLAQTAAAQSDAAASGDLWRAVTRRVRSHAAERPAAIAAMSAALAGTRDYERRYRLIDGIAAHGDAAALRVLESTLAALPVAPQSAALRQVAVRAIASTPRVEAAPLVIAFARDADPGVRLAALAALAGAETDTAGVWHAADGPDAIDRVIINGLTADTWPEVRRRAAAALGARCQRPGPARALTDAVGNAKEEYEVRADALTALVQCKAPGIAELLAKVWGDKKAMPALRERAVLQAAVLDDPLLVRPLLAAFARWRGEAIESGPALALARAAPIALGGLSAPPRIADAAVLQTLLGALDDSAFPEIVEAAALGLGAMGKNCPPAARTKLLTIARSNSQAATSARHAAGICGR